MASLSDARMVPGEERALEELPLLLWLPTLLSSRKDEEEERR